MNTRQLTKAITSALEARGVHVEVKPAVTTTSVYLAFDGGLLKQARIGDHRGKGYHYTFEIGRHVKPPFQVEMTYQGSPYTRYRYTDQQVDDLVTQVLILRSNLRAKYGKDWYDRERTARVGAA